MDDNPAVGPSYCVSSASICKKRVKWSHHWQHLKVVEPQNCMWFLSCFPQWLKSGWSKNVASSTLELVKTNIAICRATKGVVSLEHGTKSVWWSASSSTCSDVKSTEWETERELTKDARSDKKSWANANLAPETKEDLHEWDLKCHRCQVIAMHVIWILMSAVIQSPQRKKWMKCLTGPAKAIFRKSGKVGDAKDCWESKRWKWSGDCSSFRTKD